MTHIRKPRDEEVETIRTIINAAAEAYRGVIPEDRWHDPYMSADDLKREMDAGVTFMVYETAGDVAGVMGIQHVGDVDLIRHAYVLPDHQRSGIGQVLLQHFREQSLRPMLIGTWADAHWAIRFYQKEGFHIVPKDRAGELLRTYWNIPDRQVETSVVLARPQIDPDPSAGG